MHGIAPEMETFNHQKLANCNFRDAHPSGKPAECGGCERMKISQLICNRQRCGFQQRKRGDPVNKIGAWRWVLQRNKHGPMHGSLNVPIEHHPTIRYMVYNGYYKVMSNIPQMGQLPTPAMEGESVDFKLQHPAVKKSSRLMPGRRRPPSWSKVHGSLKADCRNTGDTAETQNWYWWHSWKINPGWKVELFVTTSGSFNDFEPLWVNEL